MIKNLSAVSGSVLKKLPVRCLALSLCGIYTFAYRHGGTEEAAAVDTLGTGGVRIATVLRVRARYGFTKPYEYNSIWEAHGSQKVTYVPVTLP
jgi:hypothetical protein